MVKTAVIHIGTEKTGTTTIQDLIHQNRERLCEAGYVVPGILGGTNHARLAAYAMSDGGSRTDLHARFGLVNPEQRERFDAAVEDDVAKLIAQCPEDCTVLVSSEHLQSRLSTVEEVAKLKRLLDRHFDKVKIIVYLRRQDEVAVSLYSTRLKAGNPNKAPIFPAAGAPYYDYAALVERWTRTFGRDAVDVRLFERDQWVGRDLAADFRVAAGIDGLDGLTRPARRNRSLSAFGLAYLTAFNQHVPGRVDERLNPDRGDLIAILEANYAGEHRPVSAAKARAFYDSFKAGNDALRREFFPGLERDSLFHEDFSAYPEAEEAIEYPFEMAVEASAHLWKGAAVRLREMRAENWYLRGEVSMREADYSLAVSHFQKAIAIHKTPPKRYLDAIESAEACAAASGPAHMARMAKHHVLKAAMTLKAIVRNLFVATPTTNEPAESAGRPRIK
ncbi:hypothetical protein [Maricaulis sp. CAU 1757]